MPGPGLHGEFPQLSSAIAGEYPAGVAKLNGSHAQLMRKKSGIEDDADYTDPSVPIPGFAGEPGTLLAPTSPADGTFDPSVAIGWGIMPRRADGSPLTKVKIRVVFRDSGSVEVPSTYDAVAWAVIPRHPAEGLANSRPAVEWLGAVTGQESAKPIILDVANFDVMGLSLSKITADASTVYFYVQEWA